MIRINDLKHCCSVIICLLFTGTYTAMAQQTAPPNIIFILTDDLGWSSLSASMDLRMAQAGSDYHETPHLDRLAAEGMRFSRGYAPAAICSPSRRSILFGHTPARQGNERFKERYHPYTTTYTPLPLVLKSINSRYKTAHYGKWDMRADFSPEDAGYDESDGNTGNRHGDLMTDKGDKWDTHFITEDPKRAFTLTERAINFMTRQVKNSSPFFLQLSHYATHVDMQTREETYKKYLAKQKGSKHAEPGWAGMLEDLDSSIGRLLETVDQLGISGNTYIFFMSDNGGAEFVPPVSNRLDHPDTFQTPMRNAPLRGGKWTLYEGGIRVPFLVKGPGVRAGSQCDVPATGWDLLPTFAELAAGKPVPVETGADGGSIVSLLGQNGTGAVARPVSHLVFHRHHQGYPHSALMDGDYKLIRFWKTGKTELYNLRDDPGEQQDLSVREPRRVQQLEQALSGYLKQVDPDLPVGAQIPPPRAKTNIIYILADDLGYGDVSCYNPSSKIRTPHIDRLAAQGMRFTDAHSPSSVCTPTRYGILTGEYPWRSRLPKGVLRGYGRALILPGNFTVGKLLQQQGYHTAVIGKWHLGLDWALKKGYQDVLQAGTPGINAYGLVQDMDPAYIDFTRPPEGGPTTLGFHESFILPASLDMEPYCYLEQDVLTEIPSAHTAGNDLHTGYTGAFWRAGKMAPSFVFDQVLPTFTEKAIRYVEKHAQSDHPFFLYLPLPSPHTPWLPTGSYTGSSQAGTYGDFVQMLDNAVGRIVRAIDSLGIAEHTMVVFASDNGPYWRSQHIDQYGHRAAGPYRGMKGDAWEGGHRIPFIVRWPQTVKPGTISRATTTLTNLSATCADIVRGILPEQQAQDSYSILPVLSGRAATVPGQPAVVHHASNGYFAVRQGPWKFIDGLGSGGFSEPRQETPLPSGPSGQLYQLDEDPGETRNLYDVHPGKVAELRRLLTAIKNGQQEKRDNENE